MDNTTCTYLNMPNSGIPFKKRQHHLCHNCYDTLAIYKCQYCKICFMCESCVLKHLYNCRVANKMKKRYNKRKNKLDVLWNQRVIMEYGRELLGVDAGLSEWYDNDINNIIYEMNSIFKPNNINLNDIFTPDDILVYDEKIEK